MAGEKSILLDAIKLEEIPADLPDLLTSGAEQGLANEKLKTENDLLKSAFKQSTWFAISTFILVVVYMIFIVGIIIWQGCISPELRISDKVFITILSTTTVNVLGLFYLIIKYVFHHRLKM